MIFHLSPIESNSPPVFRSPLSILTDLNNAVVCIVSVRLLISNSSRLFSKPVETVKSAPMQLVSRPLWCYITFFNLARTTNLFPFWHFFVDFHSVVHRGDKVSYTQDPLFFSFIITRSGFLSKCWWSVFKCKSLSYLFNRTDSELSIYHLVVWANICFVHNSQEIIFPTQPFLFLAVFTYYVIDRCVSTNT